MTDYSGLIERLEKGSGQNRELDGEVMFTLFAKPAGKTGYLWPEDNPSWSFAIRFPGKDREWFNKCRTAEQETIVIWRDGDPILMNSLRVPPLTSSLDAALALSAAMLPDWTWGVQTFPTADIFNPGGAQASVSHSGGYERGYASAEHGSSVPIAVLIATLRALQVKATP